MINESILGDQAPITVRTMKSQLESWKDMKLDGINVKKNITGL